MSDLFSNKRLRIARGVAAMLALPQMVCRRRSCRRSGHCWFYFPSTNQPCCLRNLDTTQRAIFDTILADAEHVAGRWGILMLTYAPPEVGRAVRELAVEIVHRLVAKEHRGRYAAWRRERALERTTPPRLPALPAIDRQCGYRREEDQAEPDWPEVTFEKVKTPVPRITVP